MPAKGCCDGGANEVGVEGESANADDEDAPEEGALAMGGCPLDAVVNVPDDDGAHEKGNKPGCEDDGVAGEEANAPAKGVLEVGGTLPKGMDDGVGGEEGACRDMLTRKVGPGT